MKETNTYKVFEETMEANSQSRYMLNLTCYWTPLHADEIARNDSIIIAMED